MGNIIFVHGTGVRNQSYKKDCELIQRKLDQYAPGWGVVECLWGDDLGVSLHLQGKSIPSYAPKPEEQSALMRWWALYQDPLYELRELAAQQGEKELVAPDQEPTWEKLDKKIKGFAPAGKLDELLAENGLDSFWEEAFNFVIASDEYSEAIEFSYSHPGHFRRKVARAVFAQTVKRASEEGVSSPSGETRDQIVNLVVGGLGGDDKGVFEIGKALLGGIKAVGNIFAAGVAATAAYTGVLSRGSITDNSLPAAGDILLYQTRGQKIRQLIKSKIEEAQQNPPVYLLAHSLGGIACVDLLAMEKIEVKGLMTAGSQSPLLYEMNCLTSLADGALLPKHFPKWLNFYDPNDLLSYIGENVFPNRVKDVEIISRQPFPQAHSAYWNAAKLWEEIEKFINSPGK